MIISSVSVLQKDLVISKLKKIIKVIFQGRRCVKKTAQSCCQKICAAEIRIYIRKGISLLYWIKQRIQIDS